MQNLNLDPGSELTAYVLFDTTTRLPVKFGKVPNRAIFSLITEFCVPVICEFPYPRGQGVSYQTLETCEWAGQFRFWAEHQDVTFTKMNRADIKRHLCPGKARAKDKDVREALIKLYGGLTALDGSRCSRCKGKGHFGRGKNLFVCGNCHGAKEMKPGPLHGVTQDVWAALAVAITHTDCGPSKSAAELQVDRKARKAAKKERDIAMIPELELKLQELTALPTRTPKQAALRDGKLRNIQTKIEKLKNLYAKSS